VASSYFDAAVRNRTAKINDFFLKYLTGGAARWLGKGATCRLGEGPLGLASCAGQRAVCSACGQAWSVRRNSGGRRLLPRRERQS
jgi:hypothetical protein